ncbi:MAG: fused MFS/spermidine synthase, partial [Acidobacteria bacterium]|nr:fused MFS/spermidine synthase [Acidobacteriota bacterium]
LNTIGAAAGSLLCGFWLISAFGVWGVILIAIILNTAIGAVCVFVSFRKAGKIALPHDGHGTAGGKAGKTPETVKAAKRAKAEEPGVFPMWLVLAVFAISGFCSMAYEVFWTKLLGLLVGPTTYSFTMVLVTFIAGLALGGMVWGLAGDRSRNPIALLGATQIAAALAALLFSQVMGNSQIFFAKLIYEFQDSFFRLHLFKGLLLFGFMVPTTFFLGAAFPLVGRIYTRSLAGAGKSIGYAYAINSIGAVLGAFSAGFILIPFLGKENGIRLVVCLQLASALFIWAKGMGMWKMQPVRKAAALAAGVFGIALTVFFPRWDHVMLSIGKYHRFDRPEIRQVGWLGALFSWEKYFPELKSEKLLFYGDGIGGFTTVLETVGLLGDVNYNLCNSGKPDASSTRDMDTQTLLAHFAMLYHPKAEDALVIGLGSGVTAGEILHYPVKQLDIVEINEQVVEASRFFLSENNNVLEDARTRLIIQDARAHLALTKRKYDLITSEPSNPWMSGIAALYTRDFFELVSARLNPGGFFVQWIPAYQMDWESFNLIGRTFVSVFPDGLMVTTNPARPSSFLFIGSNGPVNLSGGVQNLKYAQKSSNIALADSGVFFNLIVSDDLRALFGDGPVNTDNRPLLEYLAPRTMHGTDASIIRRIGLAAVSALGREITAIQKENQSGVDGQIDYAEYFLSFRGGDNSTLQYPVNLAAASPEQKERYFGIVENFCSRTLVSDFSALRDPELRNRCFMRQEAALLARLNDDTGLTPQRKAALYEYLGRINLQNQRSGKAVEYFSKGMELTPGEVTIRGNLGMALMADGQYVRAEEELAAAVRLDSGYANTRAYLGQAIAAQGLRRLDEAIAHYREALRLDPASADTCNYLGAALAEQGKYDEARIWFTRAVEIQPGHARAQINLQRLASIGR